MVFDKKGTYLQSKHLLKQIGERVLFEIQLRKDVPIFICTMGKVGSTSLFRSIKGIHSGVVLMDHIFFPDQNKWRLQKKWKLRRLYKWVVENNNPINIISSVREPIGRNISMFFQCFNAYTGVSFRNACFTNKELKALFLLNFPHDEPLKFFDRTIKRSVGIDVFSKPFSKNGYDDYSKGNKRLLVVRVDLDNEIKEQVLSDFLGILGLRLINANLGTDKEYWDLYKEFSRNVRFPEFYIEKMTESKYFHHFFGQHESNDLKSKWRT